MLKKDIKNDNSHYHSKTINGINFNDKTITDFTSKHSTTILPSSSNIKSTSTIGNLYDIEQLRDKLQKQCIYKIQNKSTDRINYNKTISATLCKCLFDKNKDIKINDLEHKVNTKQHTPASRCILLLDKYKKQNKKLIKNSSTNKSYKVQTSTSGNSYSGKSGNSFSGKSGNSYSGKSGNSYSGKSGNSFSGKSGNSYSGKSGNSKKYYNKIYKRTKKNINDMEYKTPILPKIFRKYNISKHLKKKKATRKLHKKSHYKHYKHSSISSTSSLSSLSSLSNLSSKSK